jgi:hypothetical protein
MQISCNQLVIDDGGARIDVKLRTDDLQGFRPYRYPELVATFCFMNCRTIGWATTICCLGLRVIMPKCGEHICMHASLRSTIIEGKTTAEVAGLGGNNNNNKARLVNVYECIPQELVREMAQHGLHPQMIAAPIRQR